MAAKKRKVKRKSKSRVNEAGNYTKPSMRKRLFNRIKAGSKGGKPGQWSARKAQMLAGLQGSAGIELMALKKHREPEAVDRQKWRTLRQEEQREVFTLKLFEV